MRITIHGETRVESLLACIRTSYGSLSELRTRVTKHPDDVDARVALHDFLEYRGEDPQKTIRHMREIVIPDSAIDRLTVQRLELLLTLKRFSGPGPGVRTLARRVKRDVKNVSDDLRALEGFGLVKVARQGKGRPSLIELAGDRIDLHLVEA